MQRSVFKTFATVAEIVFSYVKKYDVNKLVFTADKDDSANRVSVYNWMVSRYIPNNYHYETVDKKREIEFVITKAT